MPSKEHEALVEKVARDLATLNDGNDETWESYHADAQKACSTILAALQEHIEVLGPALQDLPLAAIKAFLETSPLGEQSE